MRALQRRLVGGQHKVLASSRIQALHTPAHTWLLRLCTRAAAEPGAEPGAGHLYFVSTGFACSSYSERAVAAAGQAQSAHADAAVV